MRILLSTALVSLLYGATILGQDRPAFDGTWVMDMTRSESAKQGVEASPRTPVTLVVSHTPVAFRIETHTDGRGETQTYTFQSADAPKAVGTTGSEGSLVETTLADWQDNTLVTTMSYRVNGMAMTKIQSWSVDESQRTMTVETLVRVEHGYESLLFKEQGHKVTKDVYAKVDR